MEQAAIARTVGVAAGAFAPGHIGELTRIVPFEMVDEVLAETSTVQQRVRLVPARVTVYLLLAGALFAELGYRQVFDRMCAGLAGLAPARPTASALRQARQRLGPAPLKVLFDLVRGPVATTAAQARWHGCWWWRSTARCCRSRTPRPTLRCSPNTGATTGPEATRRSG
ncbi:transposase domain-containing protein [Kitasatospora sp. NPDC101157]|uniref:transposase domain-containing protein n=1 Tax=Kitasatospora sp. NPDC101157 TaxID=3364098 RepID=UPI0038047594